MRFVFVVAIVAFAQLSSAAKVDSTKPTVDLQLFYPAPGVNNFFSTESGDINSHLGVSAGLVLNYAHDPLKVQILNADGSTTDVGSVVKNRLDADVVAALGLFNYADIGVVVPLVLQGGLEKDKFQDAPVPVQVGTNNLKSFTQGDIRLVPKIRPFTYENGLFSAALIPTVIFPTASKAAYAGEHAMVFAPSAAISTRASFLRFGVQAGYRFRDRTKVQTLIVDDEFFYKAAAGIGINLSQSVPLEVVGEVFGHTPAANAFGHKSKGDAKDFQKARTPLEGDIGLRWTLFNSIAFMAGGGGGLMPGYGAPAPRVFFGISYFTGNAGAADGDQDGVGDNTDKCPDRKEDRDNFEDNDGCPEVDNDKDNVLDEDDQCPNDAEDKDGYGDEDGCPEADNDKDGILDESDKCPLEAEDKDGVNDEDGCPDLDDDNDKIADSVDKCPKQPEDLDNFEDTDGCPENDNDNDGLADLNDLCPNYPEDKDGVADDDGCPEDNDGDGIPDDKDKCPAKAETYNGIEDEDGCPEALKTKSLVEVTSDKIVIKETIFFKTGSAVILPKSFALLNQVYSVLKNYKHITKIRIEGHTDSMGNRKKNLKLSQDRANSVRDFLVGKGIEAGRLESQGFGPDKPIASNKTAKGRETNRRVEFVIAEQKPVGAEVPGATPAPSETPELVAPPPPAQAPAKKPEKGKKPDSKVEEPQIEFNF